jgi:hypothetical protein
MDINALLEKAVDALQRDITVLLKESVNGLSAPRSASLTSYIKLLRDILQEDRDDEEALRKRVAAILARNGGSSGEGSPN